MFFFFFFFVAKGESTLSNIRLCSDEKLKVTAQWALTWVLQCIKHYIINVFLKKLKEAWMRILMDF